MCDRCERDASLAVVGLAATLLILRQRLPAMADEIAEAVAAPDLVAALRRLTLALPPQAAAGLAACLREIEAFGGWALAVASAGEEAVVIWQDARVQLWRAP